MIKPKDILLVGARQPLIGSQLNNAEKEAVVSALICACQKKNKWKRVRSEIIPYLEQTTMFHFNSEKCREAIFQMIDEGLIATDKDKKGQWLAVTTKLLRLLITSTYSGGEKYSNVEELLQQIKQIELDGSSVIMDYSAKHPIVNPT
jgi:sensor histidine kinase regulating citrate/malate metabolism